MTCSRINIFRVLASSRVRGTSFDIKIRNPPVLAYADYRCQFKHHTDASSTGLGAVLYQNQDGQDRVVSYASRSLRLSEKNYPAHKLKFLALKWSVTDKFHDYLYGTNFEVLTDNNPLTYVFTTAKLDATGHRWLAELSNYNFTIKYRSGKKNADADGLSRLHDSNQTTPRHIIPARRRQQRKPVKVSSPSYQTQNLGPKLRKGRKARRKPDWMTSDQWLVGLRPHVFTVNPEDVIYI